MCLGSKSCRHHKNGRKSRRCREDWVFQMLWGVIEQQQQYFTVELLNRAPVVISGNSSCVLVMAMNI